MIVMMVVIAVMMMKVVDDDRGDDCDNDDGDWCACISLALLLVALWHRLEVLAHGGRGGDGE